MHCAPFILHCFKFSGGLQSGAPSTSRDLHEDENDHLKDFQTFLGNLEKRTQVRKAVRFYHLQYFNP